MSLARRSEFSVLLAASCVSKEQVATRKNCKFIQVVWKTFSQQTLPKSRRNGQRSALVLHCEQDDPITEQRGDRIPPFVLTFTRVTNHHSFSLHCTPKCSGQ